MYGVISSVSFAYRRSCFSAVELVVILLTSLLDFAVAVVLSAGLDHTCSAFGRAIGEDQPYVKNPIRVPLRVLLLSSHLYIGALTTTLSFQTTQVLSFTGIS